MKPLLILGSGAFAIETLDVAETAGGFDTVGFVNSIERPDPNATHAGLPVFPIDDLPFGPDGGYLVAGIVSTARQKFVDTMISRGYRFASVIHPSSVISRRAALADGCIVNAGVVVSHNAVIGPHVILNRGCLIGHDVQIERFCSIGPGANVAGSVKIGIGSFLGVGAVVRDHMEIGSGCVVGAGAVVVASVPSNTLLTGLPARIVRANVNGL